MLGLTIMSAELTKTVCDNLRVERILSLSPVVLLKFEGKCAGFRAKSVHLSGHLPPKVCKIGMLSTFQREMWDFGANVEQLNHELIEKPPLKRFTILDTCKFTCGEYLKCSYSTRK